MFVGGGVGNCGRRSILLSSNDWIFSAGGWEAGQTKLKKATLYAKINLPWSCWTGNAGMDGRTGVATPFPVVGGLAYRAAMCASWWRPWFTDDRAGVICCADSESCLQLLNSCSSRSWSSCSRRCRWAIERRFTTCLIIVSVFNLERRSQDLPPLQGSDDLVFHILEAGVRVHDADVGPAIVGWQTIRHK